MRILLAPDKFKGTLSADQVCAAMSEGIHAVDETIEVIVQPLADGGEGTSDLLEQALGLQKEWVVVNDPLFRTIKAHYLRNEEVAFIEMAHASGLQLLEENERSGLNTTTFGTGDLIKHALEQGVKEIYLMIGGSATNDGGIGMAQALGYGFASADQVAFKPNGSALAEINELSRGTAHSRLTEVEFTVLCDVQNPLLGPNGASHVYGPQKGADEKEVAELERGLQNLAGLLNNGFDNAPGAGAAGGLGYGAMSFLGAKLKPGIQSVMEMTGFEQKLEGVDLIITGEGKMDLQTVEGKVIAGVSEKAAEQTIPFGVICGLAESRDKVQAQINAWGIYPLVKDEVSVDFALKHAFELVKQRTTELLTAFLKSQSNS